VESGEDARLLLVGGDDEDIDEDEEIEEQVAEANFAEKNRRVSL
jgi:hypothetical protein